MQARIQKLLDAGQSVWLDDLSRALLISGELERLIDTGIRGVTSNPTILGKAIAHGSDYDDAVAWLAPEYRDPEELFWALAIRDVQDALDLCRPLYDASSGGDGFVSLEVSPALAHDTPRTIAMARELWKRVDRPNAMIKIPATPEGIPAIEECTADGVNINVTLVFSVEMYEQAARAYVRGLQRRFGAGSSIEHVASANSLFLSRIDGSVDAILDRKVDDGQPVPHARGNTATAIARMAYQKYREIFEAPQFDAIAQRGGQAQRPLWASTGTKDPTYPDLKYVEPLVANNSVTTMPSQTLRAFLDHGDVRRDAILEGVDDARETLRALTESGVDLNAVLLHLQTAGIEKFCASFDELLVAIGRKIENLLTGPRAFT